MYQDLGEPRRSYAAFVSSVDDAIGRVLAYLRKLRLEDDTLVIFMSDNGHSLEERNHGGGGNAGPYRGAKASLFEGGIRLPCIASMPGVIPQGEVRDQFGASIDWLPTIAEVCGVQPVAEGDLDGTSILPILKSARAGDSHEVFHWQLGNQWAVREGDWKLVVNGNDGPGAKLKGPDTVFLSNLSEDLGERTNLASTHSDLVERLTRLHEEWSGRVGTD